MIPQHLLTTGSTRTRDIRTKVEKESLRCQHVLRLAHAYASGGAKHCRTYQTNSQRLIRLYGKNHGCVSSIASQLDKDSYVKRV